LTARACSRWCYLHDCPHLRCNKKRADAATGGLALPLASEVS
jgi:hypothetical protein